MLQCTYVRVLMYASCNLQVETPINVERDAKDRFVAWHFRSHDFTHAVLWTKFLVAAAARPANGPAVQAYDVLLDQLGTKWAETSTLHQADVVVISGSL